MRILRPILFLLFLCTPLAGKAGVSQDNFPADAVWYLHADLKQMRDTESGRGLYDWMHDEIFVEVHEEVGVDVGEEVDSVTAYSDSNRGTVMLIEGRVSSESREKLLDRVRDEGEVEELSYKGRDYYHFIGRHEHDDSDENGLESLGHSSYVSFAVPGRIIVTSDEKRMEALLDSNGRLAGSRDHNGALFVLTADRDFVQAGVRTEEFADDDDDWGSNIIRNTQQAAVLVADKDGFIAVEAKLVTEDPTIAQSVGGIVNGLIALQAFNSDLDPEIARVLQNTKIEVDGNSLSINTVLDPAQVLTVLDN